MFRSSKGSKMDIKSFDSRMSDDTSLLGLDAKIPGGKYDSTVGVGVEQGEVLDDGPRQFSTAVCMSVPKLEYV